VSRKNAREVSDMFVVRRARRRLSAALAASAIGAALVAGSAFAADASVAISGFAFAPASVSVSVGDRVTWTNGDGVGHTATADDASFDTGTIAGGGSDTVTFSTAGTFAYHCTIHPAMSGTITVQAAAGGGGATATTPPTDAAATNDGSSAASPDGPPVAWMALVVAASWLAGLIFARRRLLRPKLASQSWTDYSAGNRTNDGSSRASG
jgi:plastocyanin